MKTMRQLMEAVSAIPGLGETHELGHNSDSLDLKILKQRAQEKSKDGFVQHVNKDKRNGQYYISDWYDTDETVASYENGRELHNEGEAEMQTAGTASRGADYAAFDSTQGQATEESAPPGEEKLVKSLKKEYPGHEEKAFATAWSIYNKKHGKKEECAMTGMEESNISADEITNQEVRDAYTKRHEAFVNNASNKYQLADYASMLANQYAQQESRKEHGRGFDPISGRLHSADMDESVPAIDSCNQSNPANADIACAMEENMLHPNIEKYSQMMSDFLSSYVDPQEAFDVISRAMNEDGIEAEDHDMIMAELENHFFPDSTDNAGHEGSHDMSDDADALASAGHGSDEDYGVDHSEFDEAFNLQNGYDDINHASGRDYFPNGADSPVVNVTGPSGARQGDNPEQKKMQVAETHKELVYNYRNFLKESKKETKKDDKKSDKK